ncbi:MAG: hypothetical protein ACOYNL_01235 [Rickettsiales bacterium]
MLNLMEKNLKTNDGEPVSAAHPCTVHFGDDTFSWPTDGGLVPTKRISAVAVHERCGFTTNIMTDLIFKLTVNQLATSIRMHDIDDESMTMLGMLESLVIAGEIAFNDFMRRIENLFPDVFDQIDPALLDKLASYGTVD